MNHISPVTRTSLAASKSDNWGAVGTGHNVSAKPFGSQVNLLLNDWFCDFYNKCRTKYLKYFVANLQTFEHE